MYWELQPTPQGCQLIVDGQPIGSPAEPPPPGWLQRQFGILMPPEYELLRMTCSSGGQIHEWFVDDAGNIVGALGSRPSLYRLNEQLDRAGWATYEIPIAGRVSDFMSPDELQAKEACERLSPPTHERTTRSGDCVWDDGRWFYNPCPKREDFLPYCDPCTQALCGDVIVPGDEFCPPMDCSGPPPIPVDPHARVDAMQKGYDTQRAWMDAGGEGIVPDDWADAWWEGRL
jgi:hypothetical protein